MTRLTRLISELRASQGAAAELAAAQERLRMSRDLHDLLGRGLITVAIKSELVPNSHVPNPSRLWHAALSHKPIE